MTNKLASFSLSTSYTDQDGARTSIARSNIDCPYQEQAHTEVGIPDTTAGSTEYAVDFGSVGSGATLVVVKNLTANGENAGQDLWLKFNSANIESHKMYLPAGGVVAVAYPARPGSFDLTSMSVTTTATQAGLGKVSCHVFGDPT